MSAATTAVSARSIVSRWLGRLAVVLMPLSLAACMSAQPQPFEVAAPPGISAQYLAMYGEQPEETFPLPATDLSEVDPRFLRRRSPIRPARLRARSSSIPTTASSTSSARTAAPSATASASASRACPGAAAPRSPARRNGRAGRRPRR